MTQSLKRRDGGIKSKTYCKKRVHNVKNAGLCRVRGNADLILKMDGYGGTDLVKIVQRL